MPSDLFFWWPTLPLLGDLQKTKKWVISVMFYNKCFITVTQIYCIKQFLDYLHFTTNTPGWLLNDSTQLSYPYYTGSHIGRNFSKDEYTNPIKGLWETEKALTPYKHCSATAETRATEWTITQLICLKLNCCSGSLLKSFFFQVTW